MKHCGDEIGDTITVNSILISSAIFTIRLQYVPRNKLHEINEMATKFVRGKKYMLRDSQRYASKVHGAVVPLIDIANLATTLQANLTSNSLKLLNIIDRETNQSNNTAWHITPIMP